MNDKYLVIYEWYSDYNQFEGSWDWSVDEFKSLEEAKETFSARTKDNNCKNVSLVLKIK